MIKKRLPAILCVACLIMPQVMVTGCSKNKKNEKEIYSADTPWYTVTECNALASRESIPEGAIQRPEAYLALPQWGTDRVRVLTA